MFMTYDMTCVYTSIMVHEKCMYAWFSTESAKGNLAPYFLINSKQQSEFAPVAYFVENEKHWCQFPSVHHIYLTQVCAGVI